MRVAVEATCWSNRRGYGRFARGILNALAKIEPVELTLVTDESAAGDIEAPANAKVLPVRTKVTVSESASASGNRSVNDLLRMSVALSRVGADAVFFPAVYSYVPTFGPAPRIVTVHDAIPESFPGLVFPTRRGRILWSLKTRHALTAASRVVTVSPYAARQIREKLHVANRKLCVISEAADPVFSPDPGSTTPVKGRPPYLLFVGGHSPHKDLPTALRAFAKLAGHFPDVRLVFAGEIEKDNFHTETDALLALAVSLNVSERIDWLGFVPDAELASLYRGAAALVLPSFAEGFGLPMIEAAACGCPVVATHESGVEELLGDAALAFPAGNIESLTNQLALLLNSTRLAERCNKRGIVRSALYTWEAAAASLRAILSAAIEERGRSSR